MSRRIADLLIKIGADSYEFQQKAKSVEKSLGSMEKRLSSLGKSLSMQLAAPLPALGAVASQWWLSWAGLGGGCWCSACLRRLRAWSPVLPA